MLVITVLLLLLLYWNSIVTHYSIALPNPTKPFSNRLQKNFSSFIWQKPITPIGVEQCKLPYEDGGITMINIEEFWNLMKMSWFRRAQNNEDIWVKLLLHNLTEFNINTIEELIALPPQEQEHISKTYQTNSGKKPF